MMKDMIYNLIHLQLNNEYSRLEQKVASLCFYPCNENIEHGPSNRMILTSAPIFFGGSMMLE